MAKRKQGVVMTNEEYEKEYPRAKATGSKEYLDKVYSEAKFRELIFMSFLSTGDRNIGEEIFNKFFL